MSKTNEVRKLGLLRILYENPKGVYAADCVNIPGGVPRGTVYVTFDRLLDQGLCHYVDEAVPSSVTAGGAPGVPKFRRRWFPNMDGNTFYLDFLREHMVAIRDILNEPPPCL